MVRRLLSDNRLSEAARIIGFWIERGPKDADGWVELRFDDIRGLLYGFPSDDTIRKHLRMLCGSGWVERRPGGRGHGDVYRIRPAPEPTLKNRVGTEPGLKPDRLGTEAGLSDTVVVVDEEVGDRRENAREGEVPFSLSPKAQLAVVEYGDKFAGFRGALTDYLQSRVEVSRQYGYVQTVAAWLDGGDPMVFKLSNGSRAPPEERAGLLATALNELSAANEAMMKRPVGDPGNLKTKLDILCKRRSYGHNGRGAGQKGGGQAPGGGTGESIGANQPGHTWEQ